MLNNEDRCCSAPEAINKPIPGIMDTPRQKTSYNATTGASGTSSAFGTSGTSSTSSASARSGKFGAENDDSSIFDSASDPYMFNASSAEADSIGLEQNHNDFAGSCNNLEQNRKDFASRCDFAANDSDQAEPTSGGPSPRAKLDVDFSYGDSRRSQMVLLCFTQRRFKTYWDCRCTLDELQLLRYEINLYNDWIAVLLNGDAPQQCYHTIDLALTRKLANNSKYRQLLQQVGLCNDWRIAEPTCRSADRIYFSLINLTEHANSLDLPYSPRVCPEIDTLLKQYCCGTLLLDTGEYLEQILTRPFPGEGEVSLGYHILPMTQKLFRSQ